MEQHKMNNQQSPVPGWVFPALVKKELLEQFRTAQFLVACAVGLLFGIASPLAARYLPELMELAGSDQGIQILIPEPTYRDSVGQFVKNFSQIGVLVAIFLYMGGFTREKERGTLAFLKVKPVTPWAMLAAKVAAASVTLGLAMTLGTAVALGYTWLFFGAFPWVDLVASGAVLALYLFIMAWLGIGISAVVQTQAVSGVLTLGLWFVGLLLAALPKLGRFSPTSLGQTALNIGLGEQGDFAALLGAALVLILIFGAALVKLRNWEG